MATTYKTLGQAAAAATTATDLYTVPASTVALVSTITICNRAATATTYRVAIRPAGATLATSHYIAYDAAIGGNEYITLTLGLSLAATCIVTVYSASANLTFGAWGAEIS